MEKKNTTLVAVVAALSTLAGVMLIVLVLVFADVIPGKSSKSASKIDYALSELEQTSDASDGSDADEVLGNTINGNDDNKVSDSDKNDKNDDKVADKSNDKVPESEPSKQSVIMYVANVKNSIYLRSEPAENDSNIITTIPVGTQVIWHENTNSVFSEISYNGMSGYVKRDYLSSQRPVQNTPNSSYSANTTVSKYMYVANVKNSIYLRSSASENANNIITTIPLGTQVGYIERANSVFSKIKYNGTVGYAKTIYLADYYSSSYDEYLTVYNVKHSIYLRSAPYENPNNIICEIPLGAVVRYIENAGGGFYKISYNGYTGYSKSMYLRW